MVHHKVPAVLLTIWGQIMCPETFSSFLTSLLWPKFKKKCKNIFGHNSRNKYKIIFTFTNFPKIRVKYKLLTVPLTPEV